MCGRFQWTFCFFTGSAEEYLNITPLNKSAEPDLNLKQGNIFDTIGKPKKLNTFQTELTDISMDKMFNNGSPQKLSKLWL